MTTNKKLACTLSCMLALGGCASTPGNDKAAWSVSPYSKISQGVDMADDWYQKGRREQNLGRYAMAAADYRQALARNPNHADALNGLGIVHGSLGLYKEAIAEFEAALRVAPQRAIFHNNLGYALQKDGHIGEAREAFGRALVLEPGHARAAFNLARLKDQFGEQAAGPKEITDARDGGGGSVNAAGIAAVDASPEAPTLKLLSVAPQIFELRHVSGDKDAMSAPIATAPVAEVRTVAAPVRVEVSNGNGIRGMAKAAARHLRAQGVVTARLTNQKPFDQRVTEIRYRSGYREVAEKIGSAFPQKVALQESRGLRRDIQVRLVLGRDLDTRMAFAGKAPTELAMADLSGDFQP